MYFDESFHFSYKGEGKISSQIRSDFDCVVNRGQKKETVRGSVPTSGGAGRGMGFSARYRRAFLMANFSVGKDFPAIFCFSPGTCLKHDKRSQEEQ